MHNKRAVQSARRKARRVVAAANHYTIFKLPPMKQILASKQIRSRYLEAMLKKM